jgi:hypothetical protein
MSHPDCWDTLEMCNDLRISYTNGGAFLPYGCHVASTLDASLVPHRNMPLGTTAGVTPNINKVENVHQIR